MWVGRPGSGKLRSLVSAGWSRRPGPYWFGGLEFPVLSLITTSPSDPPNVPASVSLHGLKACLSRPSQAQPQPLLGPVGVRGTGRRPDLAGLGATSGLPGPIL